MAKNHNYYVPPQGNESALNPESKEHKKQQAKLRRAIASEAMRMTPEVVQYKQETVRRATRYVGGRRESRTKQNHRAINDQY